MPRRSPQDLTAAIRSDIIVGNHIPGQRLTEDALAQQFGVSRIPVREALKILAAEGFVRIAPYYGTFVAELSPTEAADLLEIRGLLEPFAAAKAALNRTDEQLVELSELVREGRRLAFRNELDALPALNNRFHALLAAGAWNGSLTEIIGQLQHKIAWVYAVELPRRAADSWNEHQLIVDALTSQDADLARDVMTRHIGQAAAAFRLRAAGA